MNENEKSKPLIIELEDAKNEFVQFIHTLQGRGLSCYLINMALSTVWMQIVDGAKNELEIVKKQTEDKQVKE